MKIRKAVITAASPTQRTLPLQTLVDTDGQTRTVLRILIGEAHRAGVDQIVVVVHPGDEAAYRAASDDPGVTFLPQEGPRGYGHAILCAEQFVGDEYFLHLVGDHVYTSGSEYGCARQLVDAAQEHGCSVSGLQATRETQLPYFGAIGGRRTGNRHGLYEIETVIEKPTPTEAEQVLFVPGLRAGYYLCFFGLHVLSPTVFSFLHARIATNGSGTAHDFSAVLATLAGRERYLGLEIVGRRFAIDRKYGLLTAQLGLGLAGCDRGDVLGILADVMVQRELAAA